MNTLREAAQQALEAMRRAVPTGKITLYEWDKALSDLADALAQQAEPVLQGPVRIKPGSYTLGATWVGGGGGSGGVGAPPQQAEPVEPVDTDCHTQGICQRSGYGIGKQADPQIEDRLARHGINPCPDCRGIGYDASGQLCWCQQNPSF